jgi:D-3-phosphoglycerate dehydrogenase / 2-oxoglutarate reductase
MQVGRRIVRGEAVMVLNIDDPLPPGLLEEIMRIQGVKDAYVVNL